MIVIRSLKLLLLALVSLVVLIAIAVALGFVRSGDDELVMLVTFTSIGLGATIVIVIVWLLVESALSRRRTGQMLIYIEQAVRLNLPLPQTFAAIAAGESRSVAARLQRATVALEQGEPLAVAMGAMPEFPSRIIGVLAAAERVGRLPQVLGRIVDQRRARSKRDMGAAASVPFYRTYSFVLSMALLVVTSMLMIFVIPRFEQIFHDFKIELPMITKVTIAISLSIGPWLALLLLVMLIAGLFGTVRARWSGGAYGLAEGPGRWILNRLPWIGRVRSYHALGESLEFAADAIEGGRPMEDSLSEAAPLAGNPVVRNQFWRWSKLLARGESLTESARNAGMPGFVVGMMGTAVSSADAAEIFRFLGRYYASRFSRAMAMLQGAFVPVVVFVMGSLVAWLALSMFLPLVALNNLLSTTRFRP